MIHCACLLAEKDNSLLLVRVRNHKLWYLPGGKIEHEESPKKTLIRELAEELGITVPIESLTYVTTVIGPSHDGKDQVTLICFAGDIPNSFKPSAEITEAAWINKDQRELMAPAVQLLVAGRG